MLVKYSVKEPAVCHRKQVLLTSIDHSVIAVMPKVGFAPVFPCTVHVMPREALQSGSAGCTYDYLGTWDVSWVFSVASLLVLLFFGWYHCAGCFLPVLPSSNDECRKLRAFGTCRRIRGLSGNFVYLSFTFTGTLIHCIKSRGRPLRSYMTRVWWLYSLPHFIRYMLPMITQSNFSLQQRDQEREGAVFPETIKGSLDPVSTWEHSVGDHLFCDKLGAPGYGFWNMHTGTFH